MRRLHSQLERFVASAGAGSNPPKRISQLCAQKRAEGYNFAMFTDKLEFVDADVTLTTFMKPGCWHFTALTDCMLMFDDTKYGTSDGDIVPDWFNWVVNEDFHVDRYENRNLVFLKYTPPNATVLRQKEDRPVLMRYSISQSGVVTFFHWSQMKTDGYKGVLISEGENDGEPFGGWDCYPTLAIWDRSLLTPDKTSFHRNAGPFQYTE